VKDKTLRKRKKTPAAKKKKIRKPTLRQQRTERPKMTVRGFYAGVRGDECGKQSWKTHHE